MRLLRPEVRQAIAAIAGLVRQAYNIETPIKNVESLVETLGGKLVYAPDAKVYKSAKDSFVIEVPTSRGEDFIRYSTARMIGHLFLHMGYQVAPSVWDKQRVNESFWDTPDCGSIELYQAHQFAVELLMPEEEFSTKLYKLANQREDKRVSILDLGKYFGVSNELVLRRAKALDLVAY